MEHFVLAADHHPGGQYDEHEVRLELKEPKERKERCLHKGGDQQEGNADPVAERAGIGADVAHGTGTRAGAKLVMISTVLRWDKLARGSTVTFRKTSWGCPVTPITRPI